jgi:putative chitinase
VDETKLQELFPKLTPFAAEYLLAAMAEFGITTPQRQAAFLAQLAHESGEFTRWEENLNYSWHGLRKVFPKYFPANDLAKAYHRQPERIANRVYANRMGNGGPLSGDGWRYRGRGPLQLTGKANYKKFGDLLGVDLISHPARAASPEVGFRIAGAYWRENGLNELADKGEFKAITILINGGLNGLEHREAYYERLKSALGIESEDSNGQSKAHGV